MTNLRKVTPEALAVVAALAALLVSLVALVVALRARATARRGADRAASRPLTTTELGTQVERLRTRVEALDAHTAAGLRHVAVVRYDAFGDVGGRLSFSAALLDDGGDGVVFSAIHARGECRTYAKGIVDGGSDATLTPEEQQALAAARADRVDA